jgi:mRNA interferase HicA
MKLADLERYLRQHDCVLVREGGSHSIWRRLGTPWQTSVPRHREIKENTARKIMAQLRIPSS